MRTFLTSFNISKMRKTILLPLLFLILLSSKAQNPEKAKLVTGPVIGTVTTTTARLWIAYRGEGKNMISLEDTASKTLYHPTRYDKINDRKGNVALNMDFTDLQPDHVYKVVYALEPIVAQPKCIVRTLADTTVKDMKFLFGSCAYMSPGFARFIFPGSSIRIFWSMKRKRADFAVWLGDNVYYIGKDYRSYDNMFARQLKIRNSFITLSEFLRNQPNYAIWDDHDYGWNDADRTFPLKDTAMKVFKGFWPNNFDHGDTVPGIYYTFRKYDAQFFMTDDRWYLDPVGDSAASFLGEAQLEWLERELKKSDATFKFICVGSQVLNDSWYGDSYAKYSVERNKLLDYIVENKIGGVIFLTGDRHYAELSKRDWKGYTFYDFTSSPFTSPIIYTKHLRGYRNDYSIESTIFYKKNFGQINITGPEGNRVCQMALYGKGGVKRWEYNIDANGIEEKSPSP